jgi:hypothetical protein
MTTVLALPTYTYTVPLRNVRHTKHQKEAAAAAAADDDDDEEEEEDDDRVAKRRRRLHPEHCGVCDTVHHVRVFYVDRVPWVCVLDTDMANGNARKSHSKATVSRLVKKASRRLLRADHSSFVPSPMGRVLKCVCLPDLVRSIDAKLSGEKKVQKRTREWLEHTQMLVNNMYQWTLAMQKMSSRPVASPPPVAPPQFEAEKAAASAAAATPSHAPTPAAPVSPLASP